MLVHAGQLQLAAGQLGRWLELQHGSPPQRGPDLRLRAGDNFGSYNDPTADSLISQTYHQQGTLDTDENYLAQNLPAIFMPKADYQLTEVSTKLHGVTPQEPTFNMTPEQWYFTK